MQVFFVFFLVKDSGKSWTVPQRRGKAEDRRVTGINPAAERQGAWISLKRGQAAPASSRQRDSGGGALPARVDAEMETAKRLAETGE